MDLVASDIDNLQFDATVVGNDDAGNPFSAMTTSTHTVDTTAGATIGVDDITADDIIDATEAGQTIAVTGVVGGDVAVGDTVRVTVNAVTTTGLVYDDAGTLRFSVDVAGSDLAADSSVSASVTTNTGDVNGEATAKARPVNDITTAMRNMWNRVKLALPKRRTARLKRFSRYS